MGNGVFYGDNMCECIYRKCDLRSPFGVHFCWFSYYENVRFNFVHISRVIKLLLFVFAVYGASVMWSGGVCQDLTHFFLRKVSVFNIKIV